MPKHAKIFGILFQKIPWSYNAYVYMCPHIQNETLKKEVYLGQDKGAVLAKNGPPKLSFHHEGGRQLPPSAPPKSATAFRDLVLKIIP